MTREIIEVFEIIRLGDDCVNMASLALMPKEMMYRKP